MELINKDERTTAMLAHVSSLGAFMVPMGHLLGPLIVWGLKKDESAFVAEQGREAVNFQLTMTLLFLPALFLGLQSAFHKSSLPAWISTVALIVLWIIDGIFSITAGRRASKGISYRYPVAIRFLK